MIYAMYTLAQKDPIALLNADSDTEDNLGRIQVLHPYASRLTPILAAASQLELKRRAFSSANMSMVYDKTK